jgi:regulatory protein
MAGRRSTRARSGRGWDAAPPRDGDAAPSQPRAGRRAAPADEGDGRPVDPAERAREICLRQLAVRPRTRAELAGALKQRGIADDIAASVLDRYGEVGMIDDRAFARAWVTSRHHGRGLAKKALATELRRKGVEPEAVGAALAELGDDTEAATARELVDRKLRSGPAGDPAAVARRLVGMLARKGYAPGLAFRVVRQAMADQAEDVDEDLDAGLQAALEAGVDPRPDEA